MFFDANRAPRLTSKNTQFFRAFIHVFRTFLSAWVLCVGEETTPQPRERQSTIDSLAALFLLSRTKGKIDTARHKREKIMIHYPFGWCLLLLGNDENE